MNSTRAEAAAGCAAEAAAGVAAKETWGLGTAWGSDSAAIFLRRAAMSRQRRLRNGLFSDKSTSAEAVNARTGSISSSAARNKVPPPSSETA